MAGIEEATRLIGYTFTLLHIHTTWDLSWVLAELISSITRVVSADFWMRNLDQAVSMFQEWMKWFRNLIFTFTLVQGGKFRGNLGVNFL